MNKFNDKTEEILDYLSMIPKNSNMLLQYDLKVISGKITLKGLINNKKISIAQMDMLDNSETDWHVHNRTEHFMLYEGKTYNIEYMEQDTKTKRKVHIKDSCYVLPNVPHRIVDVDGDSKSIIILIPGSNTYPKGIV